MTTTQMAEKPYLRIAKTMQSYGHNWEGGPEILLVQILADLRHYADVEGLDFGGADREAYEIYLQDRADA